MGRPVLFLGLALLGAACATPVGVTRIDIQTSHRLLTSSAVATGEVSENSKRILRRNLLQTRFEQEPAEACLVLLDGGEPGMNLPTAPG